MYVHNYGSLPLRDRANRWSPIQLVLLCRRGWPCLFPFPLDSLFGFRFTLAFSHSRTLSDPSPSRLAPSLNTHFSILSFPSIPYSTPSPPPFCLLNSRNSSPKKKDLSPSFHFLFIPAHFLPFVSSSRKTHINQAERERERYREREQTERKQEQCPQWCPPRTSTSRPMPGPALATTTTTTSAPPSQTRHSTRPRWPPRLLCGDLRSSCPLAPSTLHSSDELLSSHPSHTHSRHSTLSKLIFCVCLLFLFSTNRYASVLSGWDVDDKSAPNNWILLHLTSHRKFPYHAYT